MEIRSPQRGCLSRSEVWSSVNTTSQVILPQKTPFRQRGTLYQCCRGGFAFQARARPPWGRLDPLVPGTQHEHTSQARRHDAVPPVPRASGKGERAETQVTLGCSPCSPLFPRLFAISGAETRRGIVARVFRRWSGHPRRNPRCQDRHLGRCHGHHRPAQQFLRRIHDEGRIVLFNHHG